MVFENWGEVEYAKGVEQQLETVQEVASNNKPDTIIFCTHPPVVTLGRSTRPEDLTNWQGATFEASRGGRATYHGPSQQVIYPIINLTKQDRPHLKPRDIHAYLRAMEDIVITVLASYGISSQARQAPLPGYESQNVQMTGVWVGEKKICSLGLAIKKWVTYHGAALNVDRDSKAFQGIQPCGFQPSVMVSMEELLQKPVNRGELMGRLKTTLEKKIG